MSLNQASSPVRTNEISANTLNYWLSRYVALAVAEPLVGLQIVYENRSGIGQNSYVHNFNERTRLTGVTTVAQNDAAPEARATLSSGSITGDRRGLRTFILRQADAVSIEPEMATNADQLMEAMRRYWHAQVLALFSSVSASVGSAATNNTLENWDTVTALFRNANRPAGQRFAVMHPDAIRDLRADLRSNAAALFGTSFGESEARAVMNTEPGLGVPFDGYTLYESASVPVGDTTGWTNCLGVLSGEDSAFEIDVYESMNIRAQPDESRYGIWQVIGNIAGVGIRRQSSAYAFITRT